MIKIAINACYGGFGLSDVALEDLIYKGWTVTRYAPEGCYENPVAAIVDTEDRPSIINTQRYDLRDNYKNELRSHPDIIAVVEKYGDKASGIFSRVRIIEIPDGIDWEIDAYDGFETIEEKHRTWHYIEPDINP